MPGQITNGDVIGNPYRIRDTRASSLIEIWLLSAVVTIFAIRTYLHLTGYPQVDGGTLHIAHMLWGGLAMAIGFGMLLIFAHDAWKPVAAVVVGAGFGAFIDELGKFITNDNDYFYRPAIALIYGTFIALFLIARYLEQKREPTEADHLFLAVQGLQWQAIGKLDEHRQRIALEHLDASRNTSPFADHVRSMLESAELVPERQESRMLDFRARMYARYWKLVKSDWLKWFAIALFIFKGVQVLGSLSVGIVTDSFVVENGLSFSEWGAVATAVVGGMLALIGVIRSLQRRRIAAMHAFAGSILCSILFGQFFAFVSNQFFTFGNLVIELIILAMLRFALAVEDEKYPDDERPESRRDPDTGVGQLF